MIRLIHAADFHLDSPFSALTEEMAVERRREQRQLLEKLKAAVIEKDAHIVLLSGDLLDGTRYYAETYSQLIDIFSRIPSYIFISPGNHDYYSGCSPYAGMEWPENVHIFKTTQIEGISIPELNLTVWGAAFIAEESYPILSGFKVRDTSGINIMTLHGDLGNPASKYNPVSEEDIAASGLDYLGLGHQHTFSGLKKAGGTYYAYPGCPEGRGFDETGEKGIVSAFVDKSGCKLEFLPMGGRKYEVLEVDVSSRDDIYEAIEAAIPDVCDRDIYRLVLKGSWDQKPDTNAIIKRFESRFYRLEVRDATDIRRDIWEQAGEDSLRGLFLRAMKERYDQAKDEQDREAVVLAVRYGLAALENRDEI
ncbi:MAG: DNA repair exonuclease [Clostridiales bacterium]|jgi:DNA repair exonuclease SbcCD nuclease subunit|nr:DNA repair exonuclease [Clostridiales bacterium]